MKSVFRNTLFFFLFLKQACLATSQLPLHESGRRWVNISNSVCLSFCPLFFPHIICIGFYFRPPPLYWWDSVPPDCSNEWCRWFTLTFLGRGSQKASGEPSNNGHGNRSWWCGRRWPTGLSGHSCKSCVSPFQIQTAVLEFNFEPTAFVPVTMKNPMDPSKYQNIPHTLKSLKTISFFSPHDSSWLVDIEEPTRRNLELIHYSTSICNLSTPRKKSSLHIWEERWG